MKPVPDGLSPAAPAQSRRFELASRLELASRFERVRRWCSKTRGANVDPTSGAAAVFSARQRVFLLAGFVLLLMLRLPQVWLHGRFLGEEGSVFLAYAWHRPAGEALWRSFAGYLNLAANAATVMLAELVRKGVVRLEFAPYFTMTLGLLSQTIPAILILTGPARWLANRWAIIACLLIIATSPMTEEVFANVLHIQFHLALSCALILALDVPRSRRVKMAYWVPLLLAPLCGPGAIVLLPLFVLRTLLDRNPDRLAQTLVLAAGTALQMLMFYTQSPARGHLLDPATIANIMFVRLTATPYVFALFARSLGDDVYALYRTGGPAWWCMTAVSAAYFGWLLREATHGGRDAAFWLIISGLSLAAVSFGAGMLSLHPSGWFNVLEAQRYTFIPAVLLAIGLVALTMRKQGRRRYLFLALSVLTLGSGGITFLIPFEELSDGPGWRSEVALWRKDRGHLLASWPRQWKVDLSDHARPCTRPVPGALTTKDPIYCESNWLAHVTRDSAR